MSVSVKVDHPGFSRDTEIEVPGVGVVENGSTLELSADDEARFFSATGMKVREYYEDSEDWTVSGRSEAKLPTSTATNDPAVADTTPVNEGGDR